MGTHDAAPAPPAPDRGPVGAGIGARPAPGRGAGRASDFRSGGRGGRRHDTPREPGPDVRGALLRVGCRPDFADRAVTRLCASSDEPAAPTLPSGAVAAEETVFEAEARPEPVEAARPAPPPASAPEDAATGAATPFSSSTLAELYFRQGLVDRAVEVYRQVLDEEPGNERARSRLAELESAPRPIDARAARRAALERTIAGLEALLVVLQRR